MKVSENTTGLGEEQHSMEAPDAKDCKWSLAQRIAFRFAFSYLVFYCFPFPLNEIPGTGIVVTPCYKAWYALVLWVGKHIFHLNITVLPNGSGDTTFNYVELFCFVVIAAIATLVWTLLDRKRKEYRWLHDWLRVYVRYVLGATMLGYGMAKVIKTQFVFPGLSTLLEPYGLSTPMALLWNFMGYSTPYTFFAGAIEVLGGILLFFRRTTTLGALVTSAAMLNVVMMNYCYDVPVKLASSNLLLMAIFLLIPDLHRLANLLVLNRPAMPVALGAPFKARWMKIAGLGVKTLFIGYILISLTRQNLNVQKQYGDNAPKPPLYGIYDVEEFIQNGQTLPPLTTDTNRWRRLIVESPSSIFVKLMNDSPRYYSAKIDPAKNTLTLSTFGKQKEEYVFNYSRPDADHLVLQGTLVNDSVTIRLQKFDESKLPLVSTGFHWINEHPNYQ